MRIAIACWCVVILTGPALAQPASTKAEKRLSELLTPGGAPAPFASKPVAWPATKAVNAGELPIRPYAGMPARLPAPASANVKPRSAPEALPLAEYREQPTAPQQVELATAPLIRLPSVDVRTPLPIPILAQPQKDRAPLGDPAFDASLAVALKPFTPVRDRPVPFTPLNLPVPFENVRYGQLRNPPDESSTPPMIPLTKPK